MIGWAYGLLALVVAQRLLELAYASRNARNLIAKGGREEGAAHYPLFILLHGSWLIAIAWFTQPSPPVIYSLIAAFFALQVLRVWIIASLGPYWTTRIITLDNAPVRRRGPYRLIRHPNYLLVAFEIPLLPLILGLPWIAVVFGILNLMLLAYRIKIEDQVLAARRALAE